MKKNLNLKSKLSGIGLYWLSQIVLKTCKFQITNLERWQSALHSERPVIFTGWHGMTIMASALIAYHPDISNVAIILPEDWRGESLKILVEKLGAIAYQVNLEGDPSMGMARQVLRLTRLVKGGMSLYILPDGPDGPAHVIKPGIDFIARKAGAIIVPIGAYCRRAYIVPRWDRHTVPLPFSRIAYHIGEIIDHLPEDSGLADKLITDTLNRVTLQAAADYYELEQH